MLGGVRSGLDNPQWDFSPKEETDRIPIRNWQYAVLRIGGKWWEELCWLFAVMTVWGIVRRRYIRGLCPDRDATDFRRCGGPIAPRLRDRLQSRSRAA